MTRRREELAWCHQASGERDARCINTGMRQRPRQVDYVAEEEHAIEIFAANGADQRFDATDAKPGRDGTDLILLDLKYA